MNDGCRNTAKKLEKDFYCFSWTRMEKISHWREGGKKNVVAVVQRKTCISKSPGQTLHNLEATWAWFNILYCSLLFFPHCSSAPQSRITCIIGRTQTVCQHPTSWVVTRPNTLLRSAVHRLSIGRPHGWKVEAPSHLTAIYLRHCLPARQNPKGNTDTKVSHPGEQAPTIPGPYEEHQ